MASLTEALRVAGATRNDFNYWDKLGLFTSSWAPTKPGVARELTRPNALELAFIKAQARVGLPLQLAAERAGVWLRLVDEPLFPPFHALNPLTGMGHDFSNTSIELSALAGPLGDPGGDEEGWEGDKPLPLTFSFINRAEIVRRVDALFAGEGS